MLHSEAKKNSNALWSISCAYFMCDFAARGYDYLSIRGSGCLQNDNAAYQVGIGVHFLGIADVEVEVAGIALAEKLNDGGGLCVILQQGDMII